MNNRARLLLNAVLFQIGWFACVLGAQRPWLLLGALACLAVHLRWVAQDSYEWRVLLRVAACGWVLDTSLLHLGLFDFTGNRVMLPIWLALLWLLFASTLRHSLGWTAQPWWLSSLFGAVGGPLAYLGGVKLANISLPLGSWPSMLVLALIWALLLPALHRVAKWRVT